jgi:hypothetical protein
LCQDGHEKDLLVTAKSASLPQRANVDEAPRCAGFSKNHLKTVSRTFSKELKIIILNGYVQMNIKTKQVESRMLRHQFYLQLAVDSGSVLTEHLK